MKKHDEREINFDNYLYRYKSMDIERTFKVYFGKISSREKLSGAECMDQLTFYFFHPTFTILIA
ncbi:MAG: hypothetical protein IPG99_14580 [Ignavibacteria bacterium]|nr:hypothetical protein [Ignavibacteria bacterium]